MERPQAPAWQASPWGHCPSSSAPCAVPMRLSRIGQHIKDEPCAKQRALLGVLSSRSSRVSRGVRFAAPIFFGLPLVPGTRIKAVLSDDEGMGQKAYRNPACIMPVCTGEDH
jgi:hypothetical protein